MVYSLRCVYLSPKQCQLNVVLHVCVFPRKTAGFGMYTIQEASDCAHLLPLTRRPPTLRARSGNGAGDDNALRGSDFCPDPGPLFGPCPGPGPAPCSGVSADETTKETHSRHAPTLNTFPISDATVMACVLPISEPFDIVATAISNSPSSFASLDVTSLTGAIMNQAIVDNVQVIQVAAVSAMDLVVVAATGVGDADPSVVSVFMVVVVVVEVVVVAVVVGVVLRVSDDLEAFAFVPGPFVGVGIDKVMVTVPSGSPGTESVNETLFSLGLPRTDTGTGSGAWEPSCSCLMKKCCVSI
ncbi:hypothetical protein VTJ83DRAFT_6441 [Remersonia thermophila]|uniref:Uncharacterized protein n=1 Tax=Remersonia thermophila TaxID=72144 RepID=A0ABR4D680_9PEZI